MARVADVRTADKGLKLALHSDSECLCWLSDTRLLCGTEKGELLCYDTLKPQQPVWRLQAHDKACSGVAVSSAAPLVLTSSLDKSVKIWDVSSKPSLVASKQVSSCSLSFCCSL